MPPWNHPSTGIVVTARPAPPAANLLAGKGNDTLADGSTLYAAQVNQLVSAMAAFVPPAVGQTTLPTDQQAALDPWLGISWQNVQSGSNGSQASS